jgi:hypothetical protein
VNLDRRSPLQLGALGGTSAMLSACATPPPSSKSRFDPDGVFRFTHAIQGQR